MEAIGGAAADEPGPQEVEADLLVGEQRAHDDADEERRVIGQEPRISSGGAPAPSAEIRITCAGAAQIRIVDSTTQGSENPSP